MDLDSVHNEEEEPTAEPVKNESLLSVPVTKRAAVLKLELAGTSFAQIGQVAKLVYNIEPPPNKPSADNNYWNTTDEKLFAEAKRAYDGILVPFLEEPRVYKLEATKEKVWALNKEIFEEEERRRIYEEEAKAAEAARSSSSKRARRPVRSGDAKPRARKVGEPGPAILFERSDVALSLEEQLETFLDPFDVPKPWKVEVKNSEVTYYNEETRQRVTTKPAELWTSKLSLLEKLTPREDLDGYEYKESDVERRRRNRVQTEFENNLKTEIQRRTERPTLVEQVEDVLFEIVESTCLNHERELRRIHNRAKKLLRSTWSVIAQGYSMRPLGKSETEDGEIRNQVTDLEFVNASICPVGFTLPLSVPAFLFPLHEHEREVKRLADDEIRRLEEIERNRPWKEKAAIAMTIARKDPRAAYHKVIGDIKEQALLVPKLIKGTSKRALETSMNGLLTMSRDPVGSLKRISQRLQEMYQKYAPKEERDDVKQDDLLAMLDALEEQDKKQENEVVVETIPFEVLLQQLKRQPRQPYTKHPDSVMIRMTLLVDPPKHYAKRPPRTWKDDVRETAAKMEKVSEEVKSALTNTALEDVIPDNLKVTLNKLGLPVPLPPDPAILKRQKKLMKGKKSSKNVILPPLEPIATTGLSNLPNVETGPIDSAALPPIGTRAALVDPAAIGQQTAENYQEGNAVVGNDSSPAIDIAVDSLQAQQLDENSLTAANTATDVFANATSAPGPSNRIGLKSIVNSLNNIMSVKTAEVPVVLVEDRSEREQFEKQLIEDIALAVNFPSRNICIEEVRRFPINDGRIIALKKKNDLLIEKLLREEEEERLRQESEQQRRKLQTRFGGTVGTNELLLGTEPPSEEPNGDIENENVSSSSQPLSAVEEEPSEVAIDSDQQLLQQEHDNGQTAGVSMVFSDHQLPHISKGLDRTNAAANADDDSPISALVPDHQEQTIISPNEIISEERDLLVTASVKENIRTASVHSISQDPSLLMPLAIEDEPTRVANDAPADGHTATSPVPLDAAGVDPTTELLLPQTIMLNSSDKSLLPPPEVRGVASKPKYFRIGLVNPDDLKHDDSYWLAKGLRKLSDDERRQKRIAKLKLSVKETGLKANIKQLEEMRKDILEDIQEHYLEPTMDIIKPVADMLHQRLREQAKKYLQNFEKFKEIAKNRLAESARKPAHLSITADTTNEDQIGIMRDVHTDEHFSELKRQRLDRYPAEIVDLIELLVNTVEERHSLLSADDIQRVPSDMIGSDDKSVDGRNGYQQMDAEGLLENQIQEENGYSIVRSDSLRAIDEQVQQLRLQLDAVSNQKDQIDADIISRSGRVSKEENNSIDGKSAAELLISEPSLDSSSSAIVEDLSIGVRPVSAQREKEGEENENQEDDGIVDQDAVFDAKRIAHMANFPVSVVNVLATMTLAVDISEQEHQGVQEIYGEIQNYFNDDSDEQIYGSGIGLPPKPPSSGLGENDFDDNETGAASEMAEAQEEDVPDDVVGCEVVFMVFVSDEQRLQDGLEDIEAEDAAVILLQQLEDLHSVLRQGPLTQFAINVEYQLSYRQRTFNSWESFWVNFIHPCFFGFSTLKSGNKKVIDSPPTDPYDLPFGLKVVDPTSKYSERTKQAVEAIEIKAKPKITKDMDPDDVAAAKAAGGPKKKPLYVKKGEDGALAAVVDAKGNKRIKIYRPNMQALTAKDLLRLERVYQACQESYEKAMAAGLVDGQRLRQNQYLALKDRDTSHRILVAARSKYRQANNIKTDDLEIPPVEITHVTSELFDEWQMEVKKEEMLKLFEARKAKEEAKLIRQQESELRRKKDFQKLWMVSHLISKSGPNAHTIATGVNRHIEAEDELVYKYKHGQLTQEQSIDLQQRQNSQRSKIIEENKHTRHLYDLLLHRRDNEQVQFNQATAIEGKFSAERDQPSGSFDIAPEAPSNIDVENGKRGADFQPSSSIMDTSQTADHDSIAGVLIGGGDSANRNVPLSSRSSDIRATSSGPVATGDPSSPISHGLNKSFVLEIFYIARLTVTEDNCRIAVEAKRAKIKKERSLLARRMNALKASLEGVRMSSKAAQQTGAANSTLEAGIKALEVELELLLEQHRLAKVGLDAIPDHKRLTAEEFHVFKDLQWFAAYCRELMYSSSLEEYPTIDSVHYEKEELAQFAELIAELEPVFTKVTSELKKIEENARIAAEQKQKRQEERLKLRSDRKKAKEAKGQQDGSGTQKIDIASMNPQQRAEYEIEQARLERQARREKAWQRAHPHIFVTLPGLLPFCVVCKEKDFDAWLNDFKSKEEKWRGNSGDHIRDMIDDQRPDIEDAVEELYWKLESERQHYLLEGRQPSMIADKFWMQHRRKLYDIAVRFPSFRRTLKSLTSSTKDDESKQEQQQQLVKKAPVVPSTLQPLPDHVVFPLPLPAKEIDRMLKRFKEFLIQEGTLTAFDDVESTMRKLIVPLPLIYSGIGFCDPKGKNVVPQFREVEINPDDLPLPVDAGEDLVEKNGHPFALSVKIRVWHRKDKGDRGEFLGQAVVGHEDLIDPPKGMRTLTLQTDPRCVLPSKVGKEINGSVTFKVGIAKTNKKTGEPVLWTFQIIRLSDLNCAGSEIEKSNPYCELLWCGPVQKDSKMALVNRWVTVGLTTAKYGVTEVKYDKAVDSSLYELPPVWSTLPIPGRGLRQTPLTTGGWVAKNMIPEPSPPSEEVHEQPDSEDPSASSPNARKANARNMLKDVIGGIVVSNQMSQKAKELIEEEVQLKVESSQFVADAEERERRCMANEEVVMRGHVLTKFIEDTHKQASRQKMFNKDFAKMLQLVNLPPRLLARLRFLMGIELDGGAVMFICQDPTSLKNFDIIMIPIIYPEDEMMLVEQLSVLMGNQNGHLVRVIDYSAHSIRGYNSTGYASVDEHVTIAILDHYYGITFMEYLYLKWERTTDEDFRQLLRQILSGLIALHEEGILHRNFHPNCIVVEMVSPTSYIPYSYIQAEEDVGNTAPVKVAKKTAAHLPNLRLGEFWLLRNPRKAGCEYSQGRADWGAKLTTPPEVIAGHQLTDKADIYAFGLCVFHWATYGKDIPRPGSFSVEGLQSQIPLKWGTWLHNLLRMCLNENPLNRASAKDLSIFLTSRMSKAKR